MEMLNEVLMIGGAVALAFLLIPARVVVSTGLTAPALKSEFFNRFQPRDAEALYKLLAARYPSTSDREMLRWIATVPAMREMVNGRLPQGLRSESYQIENIKYEASIAVDRDEVADDQTGQITMKIAELAERAATHKDFLIAQLIERGGDADALVYDGKPFFSTTHESGESGVQSNDITHSAADTDDPTTPEFAAALRKAVGALMTFKDAEARPVNQGLPGIVAVVHPKHLWSASEALQSTMAAGGTASRAAGLAAVYPLSGLTSETKFAVGMASGALRPFVFQEREPVAFGALDQPPREVYIYGIRARYAIAYGHWQAMVRCTFVGA